MPAKTKFELKIERPVNCSKEENGRYAEAEEAVVKSFQARKDTIETFLDVACEVKGITKIQKRLNVSGGMLSIFGILSS